MRYIFFILLPLLASALAAPAEADPGAFTLMLRGDACPCDGLQPSSAL